MTWKVRIVGLGIQAEAGPAAPLAPVEPKPVLDSIHTEGGLS